MLGKCAVAFRTGLVRKGGMAWGKDACTHKEEWTPIIGMGESGSQTCFDTSKRQDLPVAIYGFAVTVHAFIVLSALS